MIQFLLNHKPVQLDNFKASTTLLDYLRSNSQLKGSKEGCASGDCGACTVVIAQLNQKQTGLEYTTLNSCICLLGSLHGKHVITVEGLKQNGSLHDVQQAMVDRHASQCGFCTPGFVMSLFAMSKQSIASGRAQIIENIDGNLCRCTGYQPIINAAEDILNKPQEDHFDQNKAATVALLKTINTGPVSDSSFFTPQNASQLAQVIKENPQARLLAGGTDLGLDVTQNLQQPEKLIYLGQVKELNQINETQTDLLLGAAVSYQKAEEKLASIYPDLRLHLHRLGSKQIRNVGTIGGNVANASPIGDMPPVLVALDATLVLQKDETLRSVKINNFYTGYKQTVLEKGEFIREIVIPKNKPDHHLKIYKISKRHADDISALCAAFYIQILDKKITSVRVAMGGMAATVKRANYCEKALMNQSLSAETLAKAKAEVLQDYDPLDDVRASREYRLLMAQNLLERLFLDLGADLR